MSSKKEEERNEKIIRGLMKLPPNRRCINCNSLGPQYVCTNFWTFVCVTCSGIHREFTHRVKSVSMSKFTSQEVESLQEGGNQRARETFLKGWDPRQQRLPDSSNVEKVREFIKSVYVDRKYYAAKTSGKPPRDVLNHRNNEDDRRASSYHSYSQSPPYDYQYEERRYGKQAPVLTRKPGSDRGILRFFSSSRLSDHVQEDKFANESPNSRVSDSSMNNGGVPFRSGAQSPSSQRDFGFSSPSSETSRDILSEDGRQSPVNTFMNLKGKREPHQRTGSSDSIGPLNTGGTAFRLADSVGKEFVAPTPEQSAATHNDKDVFPPLPNSSESGKFGGLDLFSAPSQTQESTSAPPAIDLFQLPNAVSALPVNGLQPQHSSTEPTLNVHQQSEAFGPSSLGLSSVNMSASSALDFFQLPNTYSALSVNGLQPPLSSVEQTLITHQQSKAFGPSSSELGAMAQPSSSETLNEGWAKFDMAWHVEPIHDTNSLAPLAETSTSGMSLLKFDQAVSLHESPHWFPQDFGTNIPSSSLHNQWHEGLYNIGVPPNAMDNQSWGSVDGSKLPLQSIYTQSNEQVQDASTADSYPAWAMPGDLQKADLDARPPFHSTVPQAIESFDASFEHPVAGVDSPGLEQKSRNPFDLDSDLESSNMPSLDMSSLQSALPNHSMSTPWFPASTAIPYIPGSPQDALVFMAGQAPSRQIPNIPPQGHVASISGNPFA